MPELPDVMTYIEALKPRILNQTLERVRLASPFLVRSVEPPLESVEGKRVTAIRRLGKRIVLGFEDDLFLVIHLMIRGRLRWKDPGVSIPRKLGLAAIDFPSGTLLFTEVGTKKRASLHLVDGEDGLSDLDPGGLEVLETDLTAFGKRLTGESHTVKRALTDPRLFSGIGNAYSDEILHRARMSPMQRTGQMDDEAIARLFDATQETLTEWVHRLSTQTGDNFPEKVTAFRKEMAVHGRYGKPCPVCSAPVQRIVYATNECNYCPRCQTGGRILADRALSRLLKKDWPRHLDHL